MRCRALGTLCALGALRAHSHVRVFVVPIRDRGVSDQDGRVTAGPRNCGVFGRKWHRARVGLRLAMTDSRESSRTRCRRAPGTHFRCLGRLSGDWLNESKNRRTWGAFIAQRPLERITRASGRGRRRDLSWCAPGCDRRAAQGALRRQTEQYSSSKVCRSLPKTHGSCSSVAPGTNARCCSSCCPTTPVRKRTSPCFAWCSSPFDVTLPSCALRASKSAAGTERANRRGFGSNRTQRFLIPLRDQHLELVLCQALQSLGKLRQEAALGVRVFGQDDARTRA